MILIDRTAENANFHTLCAGCDLCRRPCPESRQYATGDWESATATLVAQEHGWKVEHRGRLQQLVCRRCQKRRGRGRPPEKGRA